MFAGAKRGLQAPILSQRPIDREGDLRLRFAPMSRAPRQSSSGEPKISIDRVSDNLAFEDALAELEKLVGQLESSDLSLEQSLAAHKRGLELARFCQERLETAQQQVRVLEGDVLKKLSAAQSPTHDADHASNSGDD